MDLITLISNIFSRVNNFKSENERLNSENATLADLNSRFNQENEMLRDANTRLVSENAVLSQENSTLREQLASALSDDETDKTQIAELQAKLAAIPIQSEVEGKLKELAELIGVES
jgi:regulator of replication initiation timing